MTDQCPYCESHLNLHCKWSGHDYGTYFNIQCEQCGKALAITVHQEPLFIAKQLRCEYCNKVEVNDINKPYCAACQERLSQLSAHNEKRAKEVT